MAYNELGDGTVGGCEKRPEKERAGRFLSARFAFGSTIRKYGRSTELLSLGWHPEHAVTSYAS